MTRQNEIQTNGVPTIDLISACDLLSMQEETVAYCVDNMLPSSGLSILAGKPKAGKSTLARQLAVAVAQGQTFLGRKTSKGKVIYLALEEKPSEVKAHFEDLGLTMH